MTVQTPLFVEIFALWSAGEKPDAAQVGRDMGVPQSRARQWVRRGYLEPYYWPRLVDVVGQKFGRIVTYRQLVEATVEMRSQSALIGAQKAAETRRLRQHQQADQLLSGEAA